MEGTCNGCVFPLNEKESENICPTDTSLVYTSAAGKLSCVKELIAAGADVNAKCVCHGDGALGAAAIAGHADCLKELIAAGVDVDTKDINGRTCLMFAQDVQCCNELISAGCQR